MENPARAAALVALPGAALAFLPLPATAWDEAGWVAREGHRDTRDRPCAGERSWCRPVPDRMVGRDGTGYVLDGLRFPFSSPNSPDDRYWVCQPAGEPVACLFVPAPKI